MRNFSLLIKPAGPDCNIACEYCFYSEKGRLFTPGSHRMSDEVLETLVSKYLGIGMPVTSFAWQGGEPTMMGLDFYKRLVELQQKYAGPGQVVSNALQTNAILLDEKWCEFLKEYDWLVGISMDGPAHLHNIYRRDWAGEGTFDRVWASLERCRSHGVEFNVLVLLNDKNVVVPDEVFDFFLGLDVQFLQFITCVESDPAGGGIMPFSITAKQYGDFLCRIFDRWYENGPEKVSIRMFDSILAYLLYGKHSICIFGQKCADYMVVEHNGDAYCCDFFVDEPYKLGSILEEGLDDLIQGQKKRAFAKSKAKLNNKCLVCRFRDVCRGGCLKDRAVAGGSFDDVNYLCVGYKQFFDYAMPKFQRIAAEFAQKQT